MYADPSFPVRRRVQQRRLDRDGLGGFVWASQIFVWASQM